MKTIRQRITTVAQLLIVLTLLQSCVIYHKNPATLEEAARARNKTKVSNVNGATLKFRYIEYTDGAFFGVNKRFGQSSRTPLTEGEVTEVFLKDTKASGWANVFIAVGVVFALAIGGRSYIDNNGLVGGDLELF